MVSATAVMVEEAIRRADMWNRPLEGVRGLMGQPIEPPGVGVGGVPTIFHEPKGAPDNRIIVYLHGGGYCLGVYDANNAFVAGMADGIGCTIAMPDYRLAPEHPFPAAIEDALSVYRGLLARGIDHRNIALAGDSSGCGLALVIMSILRDNGEPLPAGAALMTPMVDCTHSGDSIVDRADLDPFAPKPEYRIIDNYTRGLDEASPLISPLFADLSGIPPILIHGADHDVFLSDAVRLHERLTGCGVESSMRVWEGMWHVFHMTAAHVPEAAEAMAEVRGFLRGILRLD